MKYYQPEISCVIKALNAIAVRADSAAYSSYIAYDTGKKNTSPLSTKQKKGKKKREIFFSDIVNSSHSCQFCLVRYMYGVVRLFKTEVSNTPILSFNDEN